MSHLYCMLISNTFTRMVHVYHKIHILMESRPSIALPGFMCVEEMPLPNLEPSRLGPVTIQRILLEFRSDFGSDADADLSIRSRSCASTELDFSEPTSPMRD